MEPSLRTRLRGGARVALSVQNHFGKPFRHQCVEIRHAARSPMSWVVNDDGGTPKTVMELRRTVRCFCCPSVAPTMSHIPLCRAMQFSERSCVSFHSLRPPTVRFDSLPREAYY